MKKILIIIAGVAGVFLAFAASAQIQYSNAFWVATNATGNMYPSGRTLDSPLDGSTEANFDANMRALPPYSVIHLLPGTFHTDGNGFVQSGQKYIGSGMDVTIVQNTPSAADGATVFRNYYWSAALNVTNAEVSDLTADANCVAAGVNRNGVSLFGTRNAVRRVKAMNMSAFGPGNEALGIGLNNYFLPDSVGNIIEECEVTNHLYGSVSGIGMAGVAGGDNGIIRGNREFLSQSTADSETNANFGINIPFGDRILVEGNYIKGATAAVYCDTGPCTNVIITGNTFEDVVQGVTLSTINGPMQDITAAFNNIGLAPTTSFTSCGFRFDGYGNTNILIFGNTIRLMEPDPTIAVAIYAANSMGLVFANNSIDPTIAANQGAIANAHNNYNASLYNNTDLYGDYLPILNIPTIGGTALSSFILNLVSSANAASALTNLGLPGNPANVVTNNESGVTLNGTFSGDGSGLSNLPVSGLVSDSEPVSVQYFSWDQVQQPPYCGNSPIMDFIGIGASGIWPMSKTAQFVGAARLGYTNITVSTVIYTTNTFTLTSFGALFALNFETNGLNGGFSGNFAMLSPNANYSFYGTNALPVSCKFAVPYGILTNAYNGDVSVMPFGTPSNIWVGQITITNSLF